MITQKKTVTHCLLFILQPINLRNCTRLLSQSHHALNLPMATVAIDQNVGKILVETCRNLVRNLLQS